MVCDIFCAPICAAGTNRHVPRTLAHAFCSNCANLCTWINRNVKKPTHHVLVFYLETQQPQGTNGFQRHVILMHDRKSSQMSSRITSKDKPVIISLPGFMINKPFCCRCCRTVQASNELGSFLFGHSAPPPASAWHDDGGMPVGDDCVGSVGRSHGNVSNEGSV
jgi:hypothetical protein